MKSLRIICLLWLFAAFMCCPSAAEVIFRGTPKPFDGPVTGQYGRLIWRQDFENTDRIGDYSYDPAYHSPYTLTSSVALADPTFIYTGDGDGTAPTFAIVPRTDGEGMCLSMTGHTMYPIYKLNFGGDILSRPGKYTLVIRAMNDGEPFTANCRFNPNRCYQGAPVIGHFDAPSDHFGTSAYSFTVRTREEFDQTGLSESDYTVTDVYAFMYAYLFLSNGFDRTCFLDDLELWYDEYADITFVTDAPDPSVDEILANTFPVLHQSFKTGTKLPVPALPGSAYEFVCWSQTPQSADHPVTTAVPGMQTLYAVFREREGGALPAHMSVYETVIDLAKLCAARLSDTSLPSDAGYAACYACLAAHDALPSVPPDDCTAYILRGDFAELLNAVLPDGEKTPINTITSLPDVFPYDACYDAVLSLCRAGILSGTDEYGTFAPLEYLSRADYTLFMSRVNGLHESYTVKESTLPVDTMVPDISPRTAFSAQFIAAPALYLETTAQMPPSSLPMGSFLLPMVTRSHIRRDFTVSKEIIAAECEFQSDNPFDLYINGVRIPESVDDGGWHLTGLCGIRSLVKKGNNRISIRGYTADDPTYAVCSLRGTVKLTFSDGTTQYVKTDSSFKNAPVCDFWAGTEPTGWETSDIPANYAGVPSYTVHPRLLRRSCCFRKTFGVTKPVRSAMLYAAAKGMYVPYLNGTRLTEARFLPGAMTGITEYQTFDVTDVLQSGANTLGALSGNGFYNCTSWGTLEAKRNAVMMQLEIEYADGTRDRILTDNTWRVTASAIYDNDLQFGERYDARLALDNWCTAAVDDSSWASAEPVSFGTLTFAPATYEPVRVTHTDRAKKIGTVLDGEYVLYDFGTNEAGRVSLTLHDTMPGERIIIRYCEALVGDTPAVGAYGDVYFEADNKADAIAPYGGRNIDVYICRGAETETYTPEFTYTGFRYIYIKGYSGTYDYTTVRRAVMHNDLAVTGDFYTDDQDLAEIWDAVKRSFRSNLVGGATDCPTREKNFWNGDLQMFVSTACRYMDVNELFSCWTMYGKKLQYDVYGWEDEEYIVPLALYRYYGNTGILEKKYPTILSLMNKRRSQLAPDALLPTDHSPYNDHGARQNVPSDYYAAAFYCRMYRDTAEIARVLGKESDADAFMQTFGECRAAFNEKYFDVDMQDYLPHNQSAIVLALAFDLVPADKRQAVAAKLHEYVAAANYHLTCGFTSMEYVLGLLCDYGYADDAYRILHAVDSPSLLYMIRSHGGGTTTEGLGGFSGGDGGGSLNHFAIGGISRFFFEYLGGIKIRKAAFREVDIIPYFYEEIGSCETPYESDSGSISSEWRYDEPTHLFTWTVTVPRGVTAYCRVPDGFGILEEETLLPAHTVRTVTDGTYTYTVCRLPSVAADKSGIRIHGALPSDCRVSLALYDADHRLTVFRTSAYDGDMTFGALCDFFDRAAVFFTSASDPTRPLLPAVSVYPSLPRQEENP